MQVAVTLFLRDFNLDVLCVYVGWFVSGVYISGCYLLCGGRCAYCVMGIELVSCFVGYWRGLLVTLLFGLSE